MSIKHVLKPSRYARRSFCPFVWDCKICFPSSQLIKYETSLQIVLYKTGFSISHFFHVGCVRVIQKGFPNYNRTSISSVSNPCAFQHWL